MVLLRLLWQSDLLLAKILLSGIAGLSRMQTHVHGLVLWVMIGRLFAVLLRQWHQRLLGEALDLREKSTGWLSISLSGALMGVVVFRPLVSTWTVRQILWNSVSNGSRTAGFQ